MNANLSPEERAECDAMLRDLDTGRIRAALAGLIEPWIQVAAVNYMHARAAIRARIRQWRD